MGQLTAALAFGDFLPVGVDAYSDSESGLLDEFNKDRSEGADFAEVPAIDHDEDLVVFLVAISRGQVDGVAEMNTGPVASLERDPAYRKPLARARSNWEKFRKHAAKRGVDVGDGKLWLTQVEVG